MCVLENDRMVRDRYKREGGERGMEIDVIRERKI